MKTEKEAIKYALNLYYAFQLELAGVWGARYCEVSKLVREATGLRTRNKNKLFVEFQNILKRSKVLV